MPQIQSKEKIHERKVPSFCKRRKYSEHNPGIRKKMYNVKTFLREIMQLKAVQGRVLLPKKVENFLCVAKFSLCIVCLLCDCLKEFVFKINIFLWV